MEHERENGRWESQLEGDWAVVGGNRGLDRAEGTSILHNSRLGRQYRSEETRRDLEEGSWEVVSLFLMSDLWDHLYQQQELLH